MLAARVEQKNAAQEEDQAPPVTGATRSRLPFVCRMKTSPALWTEQFVKGHSSTVSGGARFISVGRSTSTNGKSSTEVGVGAGPGANGSWSGQYLWHATDLW